VDWTVTTPSVTAAPDGPGEQREGTPAVCAATDLPKRAGYHRLLHGRPARAILQQAIDWAAVSYFSPVVSAGSMQVMKLPYWYRCTTNDAVTEPLQSAPT
jgi:hypothetical protein